MKVVEMAAGPSLHETHTLIFFVLTLIFLAFATITPMLVNPSRSQERRIYWIGIAGAAISIFPACLPYWKYSIGASLVVAAFMTASAYKNGPNIKIRGKIYAFHVRDRLPDPSPDGTPAPGTDKPDYDPAPDAYGGSVTAKKFWWLVTGMMAMCAANIIIPDSHKPWLLVPSAVAMLVVSALGLGYADASWGYPIARSQRIQFVILAVITAAAFTVLYLAGHAAGKRWPLRRKDSFEYRAHPRHWNNKP